MRRLSIHICVIIFIAYIVNGTSFASLNQEPMQLSESQQRELSIFFSNFAETFLRPFEKEQISDEALVNFALGHLGVNRGYRNLKRWDNYRWAAAAEEVDYLTNKYFGRTVKIHQSIPFHPFVEEHYLSMYGGGEVILFSQLKYLYDNGDGTLTAIVWSYSSHDTINPRREVVSIKANKDGSYLATQVDVYPDGTEKMSEGRINLGSEYTAIIKPVYEGDSKRYILIEYLKTRDFH